MFARFPPVVRRVGRVAGGLGVSLALIALAALLEFMGLWTYAGFKTSGDPALGSLILAAAVACLSAGTMAFVFAVTDRRLSETRVFGAVAAVVGLAFTIWLTSAN